MRRLRRRWRILKWAGLVASLLIALAWAVSILWTWGVWGRWISDDRTTCSWFEYELGAGSLFGHHDWDSLASPKTWPGPLHILKFRSYVREEIVWTPAWDRNVTHGTMSTTSSRLRGYLPLWIPFLIVAIPTAFLWWIDHRVSPRNWSQRREWMVRQWPRAWVCAGLATLVFLASVVLVAFVIDAVANALGLTDRLFHLSATLHIPEWVVPLVIYLSVDLVISFSLARFAYLHLRWRSVPPAHCRGCGYNLTGNVSGICPECGMKIGEYVNST